VDPIFPVRTNVLHPLNWTREAGVVLRRFEQEVIRKAKTQGYDGQNDTRLV
jgi:phosphoribosylaminoimidazole carboxylase (NCAIR synthetase)